MSNLSKSQSAVDAAAEKYRSHGYQVVFQPSEDLLPREAGAFQPDFLATHGNENIVVEVRSRSALRDDQQIRRYAELFRKLPGWRFDIVVIPDEPTPAPVSKLLSRESCRRRLEIADSLASGSRDIEGAILLVWTTIEAALRAEMGESDHLLLMTGARLAKDAYSRGLLSKKDWESLDRLAGVRNQVVHGEVSTRVTKATYKTARSIAARLIEQIA